MRLEKIHQIAVQCTLVSALLCAAVDSTAETRDFSQGNYLISSAVMSQYEATAFCYNQGARQLTSVESDRENQEILGALFDALEIFGSGKFGWTSGSGANWIDRTYKWLSTDELALFDQFQTEKPELGMSWGEWTAMGILIGNGSYWQLERKFNTHHAICEKN